MSEREEKQEERDEASEDGRHSSLVCTAFSHARQLWVFSTRDSATDRSTGTAEGTATTTTSRERYDVRITSSQSIRKDFTEALHACRTICKVSETATTVTIDAARAQYTQDRTSALSVKHPNMDMAIYDGKYCCLRRQLSLHFRRSNQPRCNVGALIASISTQPHQPADLPHPSVVWPWRPQRRSQRYGITGGKTVSHRKNDKFKQVASRLPLFSPSI